MEETDTSITLTKLDAARRQLETAVKLWFDEEDAVSIHTLVAAAHRVVHDVAEHHGMDGAVLIDSNRLTQWGYNAKEFKKAIRQAETFFKHAENDPEDTYTFATGQTEFLLYSAIECYHRLDPTKSKMLALYMAWLHFHHPQTLSEFGRNKFAEVISFLSTTSRRDFFQNLHDTDFTGL